MDTVHKCPNGHELSSPNVRILVANGQVACPQCGADVRLEEASTFHDKSAPPAQRADQPSLTGYNVLSELGRGGMGVVYRAYDVQRKRFVALKTMQFAEPTALFRFKQEFRTLAGLVHRNLVTLHELVSDGRQWFFTMEMVEGSSFLHHVRSNVSDAAPPAESPRQGAEESSDSFQLPDTATILPLPAKTDTPPARGPSWSAASGLSAVQLQSLRAALRQLASGIQALHEAGKLHRDVKPGNVMVTRQGRVVLLDFGLAAELDQAGIHQSTEKHLLGTIAYMAPEQAASQPVSAATDWYAVGVMLYEALTGKLPFEGPPGELLSKKQCLDPPAPRSVHPHIPEDLDRLAVELLRRDPRARPSGAEILKRLSGGETVVSHQAPRAAAHALIGRKPHLEAMADAFALARQGKTVVLQIHGQSGAGKSALVRFFLDRLVEGEEAVVLAGRCYEQEAVPYKALDSLVDALSRHLLHLSTLEAAALLPRDVLALARVFPVLRRVEAVARAPHRPLDLSDPQEGRRRALAALRELLGRLGDRRPLVLFIDDLQWGDADSAALLDDLLRPPDSPALLLLVVYRIEDVETSPCLQAVFGGLLPGGADREDSPSPAKNPSMSALVLRQLSVDPLTLEEGRDLVLTLLDESFPEARTKAELISRESGGNPFFLYELVQHVLSARSGISESARKSAVSVPASSARPDAASYDPCREEAGEDVSLHEVLWSRILRLPEEARRLLEVVAVAGRPLRQTEACQAAGLEGEDSAAPALLRSARFVRSTSVTERNEIETYHDRIRETVVAHLPPDTLRLHHGRLAAALEAANGSDPEFLAIHFEGAGQPVQAARYYALAASQATEALAFDRAAKLYRLALSYRNQESANLDDALSQAAENERALRTCLGDALANAGRGADSARAYLAAAIGAGPSQALELQRRAALQFLTSGHVDEGLDALRAVLSAVGMPMPKSARAAFWSLVVRRMQLYVRGIGYRLRGADEISAEDLRRIDVCWSAAAGLSMVDTIQGAYFQTRGLLLALAAGEPFHLARALAMEAGHVSIGGGGSRQRTQRLLQKAEKLAWEVDDRYPLGMVSLCRGVSAAFEGNWRTALAQCDQAESIFRGSCTGVVWELDSAQCFGLWALMFMGNVPEMARRLSLLLKEAQERDDLYAVTNLSLVVGTFVKLAQDEPELAFKEVRRVMANWSRQGFHVQHVRSVSDEVSIDLYRGNAKRAWDRLAEHWPTLAGSHFFRVQQVRVESWYLRARCALAAATASDSRRFLSLAEKDARALRKERVLWAEALARLIQAGVAARRSAGDATALLRESAAALDGVEMFLHAAAARHELGRLAGGTKGASLIADAAAWMKERKIANPARMAALLAPGFTENPAT